MRLDHIPGTVHTIVCTDKILEHLAEHFGKADGSTTTLSSLYGIRVLHYPTAEEALGRAILMGDARGVLLLKEESDG